MTGSQSLTASPRIVGSHDLWIACPEVVPACGCPSGQALRGMCSQGLTASGVRNARVDGRLIEETGLDFE